jgi:hypothetical protein
MFMKSSQWVSSLVLAVGMVVPALGQGYPPAASGANPICTRLEAQLASVDRGSDDPARAEQLRRYREAAAKQQSELDRMVVQSRRIGCEGSGFFSLFGGQPAECSGLNSQIQRMRANLDNILSGLERLQGGSADREGRRGAVIGALAQNNCGPQYRSAAVQQQRGFFDSLFGGNETVVTPPGGAGGPDVPQPASGGYRTLCVRTCDGYYFPISFSTNQSRFRDDEQACHRMCPGAETVLYTHRNPGEDVKAAVSLDGRPYTALPTAFQYRTSYNSACSCRAPGQSWADALKSSSDSTVERGDIVVTEERAKQLALPANQQNRSKGAAATPAPGAAASADSPESDPNRKVRSVGPNFYPVR